MPGELIPRLHVITDDAVLARPDFLRVATEMLLVVQRRLALHIRAHSSSGAELFRITRELANKASFVNALLVVNDRIDIAIAAGAGAVQLGARTLPIADARALLPANMRIGYSAHAAAEAFAAQEAGANFILAGTIYPSASHAAEPAAGLALLHECVQECSAPVVAIGGITLERVSEVERTGAWGVAAISAIWHVADPVQEAEKLSRLLYE